MSFEIEGKLIAKWDTEKKTETFSVREFAIETLDENYPQFVKFQAVQDRCDLIDNFKKDQVIKVHFDLRGRKYDGKVFTNLNAWRIEAVNREQAAPAQQTQTTATAQPVPEKEISDQDLPF